ncbi:adenosylcobinamide-GDP ribazoletransferase [Bryobacter aggregatus]|uniref:adenosylcobinamide-GDP ribazoletransferase n=1 Tax=Bryobacter aggregatus TaxID=360054 RepID=UPI0004E27B8D|nr:adenosylcobinamide-GDP ribazoletransferase [Bryobacter aggregatus]
MNFLEKLLLRLMGAFQFLTVLPIQGRTAPVHESAPFFPIVGAMIGLFSSLPMAWLPTPMGLNAALTLAIQLVLTGMLHEDGLMDIADAVRKGRTRERIFAILKDSHVGAFGAATIGIALILRWQGLEGTANPYLNPFQIMGYVAAAEGLSRCAILWLALVTPAAREGSGASLSENRNFFLLLASIVQAVFLSSFIALGLRLWLLGGLLLIVAIARRYFIARLGGVVGDCFGAVQQVAVIYCLVVYSWPTF